MKNKLSKLFGIGALSACLLGGGLCFANKNDNAIIEKTANAYNSISNSTPAYFKATNIFDTYSFVDINNDEWANLSFAVDLTETEDRFVGTYFNGSLYNAFDITNITTSLNGKTIEGIDYSGAMPSFHESTYEYKKTTDAEIDINKTYYTLIGGTDEYAEVTSPIASLLSTYYERVELKDYMYGLNFYHETLNLDLSVDLEKDTCSIDGNKLTVNEQGLVSVTITYTKYDFSLAPDSAVPTLNQENMSPSEKITYNFFLLDRYSYLERGTTDSPAISYNEDIINRTASSTPYKYNYFYNYKFDSVPNITYDPTLYEVTVVKVGSNNSSRTNKIKYDYFAKQFSIYDSTDSVVTNPEISPVLREDNGSVNVDIYFSNLGEYVIQYNPICISNGTYYEIDTEIKSQRFYVFGYQAYYTLASAEYAELKTYGGNKTSYSNSADITYRFNRETSPLVITPADLNNSLNSIITELTATTDPDGNPISMALASTDQTPVKFETIDGITPNSNSKLYYSSNGTTWEERDFSVVENYSTPGRYIVDLKYNFASYTNKAGNINSTEEFSQYFAFEIAKSTPTETLNVFNINSESAVEENISDKGYTNDKVYIRYDSYANIYFKPVRFELVRYDYNNEVTTSEDIDWYASGQNYALDKNGTIAVEHDGNYKINIYLAGSTNPIERYFNIDTNSNFNLKSYSVEKDPTSQNQFASKEIDILTNQPILFSWDNVKKSGATTFGYWKSYSISTKQLYDSEGNFLKEYISAFINKNVLPVEYELNLSTSASWIQYDNFNYDANANKPVNSSYIKPNAGLHILQTQDIAGNTQTKIFIVDYSTPVFLSYNPNTTNYELLSKHNTLTEDATIIWGDYKVIKIPKLADGSSVIEDLDSNLFKNKENKYDPHIYEAFAEILCGDELTDTNEKANISYLSLPNKTSVQSSYYLCVKINDDVYFKDAYTDTEYKFISGSANDFSYDIVSSYKLYQFKDSGKLYRSTTQGTGAYLSIEEKSEYPEYNLDASNLIELQTYIYGGSNYLFTYKVDEISRYRLFDIKTNMVGDYVNVTSDETNLYYNGNALTPVDFVDKEGQYVFLLRDQSNTKGRAYNKAEQYLSYPSAYQYIDITGDQSRLTTYFIEENNNKISLSTSSYFVIESEEIDTGTINAEYINKKKSYFAPTNEDVLYISFIPTTIFGDKNIQVESVKVTFYEFKTEVYNTISGIFSGYANSTVYNYYKSLGEAYKDVLIYQYEEGITQTDEFVYELNIVEEKTKAGFYEITRTYMTNEDKSGTGQTDYLVTTYDYHERKHNVYVDRYNTVTQSEPISPRLTEHSVKITEKISEFEQQTYTFKVLSVPGDLNGDTSITYSKYLYVPYNTDDNKIYATGTNAEGKTVYLDVSSMFKFQFKLKGSNTYSDNIYWADLISGNRKNFTDPSGQTYLLIDTSGENGLTIKGSACFGFNKIHAVNTNIGGIAYTFENEIKTDVTSRSDQSLVGGSMQLTMYSTYSRSTVLSLAYPGQTNESVMLFNSGDSFYTSEDTSNVANLTSRLGSGTNKLPVSIAIPKYKYTTYFVKSVRTSALNSSDNVVCNYVYETDILSYFNQGDKANSSISSYELEVEVDYYANGIQENTLPTKVYKSNGTIYNNIHAAGSDASGYLALYEYDHQTGVYGSLHNEFTDAGCYVVRITQAPYEVASSSYNFKSTYSFRFDIERNRPEFDLYSGMLLKSISDSGFYEDYSSLENEENKLYYTNKDEVSVKWTDSSSIYKANIDKTEIQITIAGSHGLYNGSYKLSLTEPSKGETNGHVNVSVYNGSVWMNVPELSAFFTYTYSSSTLTNTLSFNLKELQMNINNAQATIKMQLIGHNPAYYKTTSKTIVFDKTASNNTIASLHSFLYSTNYGLSQEEIREYYEADGTTQTDVSNASYNQTVSSGVYSQYSFTVTRDFFEGLKANVKSNIDSGLHSLTTAVYFKPIDSSYTPTSNRYSFVANDFTQITDTTVINEDNILINKSYEIVERDLAGNLTIYIVYVTSPDNTYTYNDETLHDSYDLSNGLTYKIKNDEKALSIGDSEMVSNKYDISASTDFEIKKVNHLGDDWNYFYTSIYNSNLGTYLNSYYLITPEIESGYAYKITGVSSKTYTKFALADLFNSAEGNFKSYIYVLNKLTGLYDKIAISLSDSARLSFITGEYGTDETRVAYFSIALPSYALTNTELIQARPIEIEIVDKSNKAENCIFGEVEIDGLPSNINDPGRNNPNDFVLEETYDYLTSWLAKSNEYVTVTYENNYLTFTIQSVRNDTKLSYRIVDNFGNEINEIYLVGETKVEEITSNGNVYNYFAEIDNNVNSTYISSQEINANYNKEKYHVAVYLLSQKTTGTGLEEIPAGKYLDTTKFSSTNHLLPFYITPSSKGSIGSYTFGSTQHQYDIWLRVEYYDTEDIVAGYVYNVEDAMKVYYIRLYNMLPNKGDDTTTENDYYFAFTNSNGGDDTSELLTPLTNINGIETFTLNGKTYTVYSNQQTFSDELKVAYSSSASLDFPYEVLYYSTAEGWNNGEDFVPLASGSVLNTNGIYYLLVRYAHSTVLTNEYYLFKIEILGSDGGYYYVLANGERKEAAPTYYTYNGTQFSNYYIVNISSGDRGLEEKFDIVTNDYQNVKAFEFAVPIFEATGIYTYRYVVTNYLLDDLGTVPTNATDADAANVAPKENGVSPFKQYVFVTFLTPPENNDLLAITTQGSTSNLYYKTNDTNDIYVTSSTNQITMIIYDETADTDSMTISWFKYYGIQSNLINAYLEKDGKKVSISTHESGNYYYINLTRSGLYSLRFEDVAGNVQSFYSGQKYLPLVFIKDVHFTTSYTNPVTGEIEETEAINKAVYNSKVTLKLNQLLIPYYQSSGFGSGNIITVYKDGKPYGHAKEETKGYVFSSEDYSFTFEEAGYYTVSMDANSKSTGDKIRNEVYSFSIINPRESRYAFEFSGYKDYYIESVIKDGIDITDTLYSLLKTNTNFTTLSVVEGNKVVAKNYLKSLLVSYFDEKTGSGRYQITINSNDELYIDENEGTSTFTFEFYINSQTVPISVSIEDGGSTTDDVNVNFNAKNVYDAVGECYVVVGNEIYYVDETTVDAVTLILGDNERNNHTYYIQVFSMSGNLLFSHRVNLAEPMNAWTIIAIIAGVIAVVLIVFIIVKLRKRMGVK